MFGSLKVISDNTCPKIGKGASSRVYIKSQNGSKIAVKQVNKTVDSSLIVNQATIISACDHPNIIKMYRHYSTIDGIYIELEHVDGGNLSQTKLNGDFGKLEKWVRQIVSALKYLHERGIIHRDIKHDNLMLDHNGNIKVIDFGVSIWQWLIPYQCQYAIGSPCYMAPEMIMRQEFNATVDIYALGVTVYQLIHGYYPFSGMSKVDYWQKTLHRKVEISEKCPQKWRFLLTKMLNIDGKTRINARELELLLEVYEPKTVVIGQKPK